MYFKACTVVKKKFQKHDSLVMKEVRPWEPTELSSAAPGVGSRTLSLTLTQCLSVSWRPLLVTEGSADGCAAPPGTGSKGDSRSPDALAAGPSLQQDPRGRFFKGFVMSQTLSCVSLRVSKE